MSHGLVFVDAVKAETEKAFLLEIKGMDLWCPRSLIDNDEDAEFSKAERDFGDTNCELYIADFWCEDYGL